MSNSDDRAAIKIQGKAVDITVDNCVVVGGGLIVATETSELSGLKVQGTQVFDSVDSFLAYLGLPPGGDYRGLGDVLDRAVSDANHQVSEQDRGILAKMLGNAANLTTVVAGITALAQSPQAAMLVTLIRRTFGG